MCVVATCVTTHLCESRQPKAHGREDVKVTKETWQLVPFLYYYFFEKKVGTVSRTTIRSRLVFLNRCHIKCSDVNSNVRMSV